MLSRLAALNPAPPRSRNSRGALSARLTEGRAGGALVNVHNAGTAMCQAEAIKWTCISQNFNDRRARATHSDWQSLSR